MASEEAMALLRYVNAIGDGIPPESPLIRWLRERRSPDLDAIARKVAARATLPSAPQTSGASPSELKRGE